MSHATFARRLGDLARKHGRLAQGIDYRIGRDGLITAHPRRAAPRLPWRQLATLALAALVFKAFLLASLGEATYAARLDALRGGTPAERAGAWVMGLDPATVALSGALRAVAVRPAPPDATP